ncbi:hypothetical protein E4U60_007537, partial [Claviceps pazoutovae]
MHSQTTPRPRGIVAQWISHLGLREPSWREDISWLKVPSHAQDTSTEAVLTAFAGMEPDMVLDHLQTHRDGLTDEQAD